VTCHRFKFTAFIPGLCLALISCAPTTVKPATQSELPAFCAEIPRLGWEIYEKIETDSSWFVTHQLADNLYAISEPYQWQEVINYLIVGDDRALLFDTGNGIGDIKAIIDQIAALPVTALASHSHIDHVGGHWQFSDVLAPDTAYTAAREKGQNNEFVGQRGRPLQAIAGRCHNRYAPDKAVHPGGPGKRRNTD